MYSGSNARSWDILPGGGLLDLFGIDNLTRLGIYIDETNGAAGDIQREDPFFPDAACPVVSGLKKNDTPEGAGLALEIGVIHPERAVVSSRHSRINVTHLCHFRRR